MQSAKYKVLGFALMMALASSANSRQLGGQAGSFLRLGLGADRVAMGDVGVAMSGAAGSWYYNPASVPSTVNKQATIGYRAMAFDRSILYLGFATPLQGNAGLSLGLMRAATSNIDGRDSNGERFDEMENSDNLIHGTFALQPHPKVAIGVSIKWMINAVPNILDDDKNLYAYGMGVDIGLRVVPTKWLRIGLQLRDINAKYGWDTADVWADGSGAKDDEFPRLVRLGASLEPRSDLTLAADLLLNTSEVGKSSDAYGVHFGGEYRLQADKDKGIALRAGWNGENPTFGLGFVLRLRHRMHARMDYAYIVESVAPSGSHVVGWTFGM